MEVGEEEEDDGEEDVVVLINDVDGGACIFVVVDGDDAELLLLSIIVLLLTPVGWSDDVDADGTIDGVGADVELSEVDEFDDVVLVAVVVVVGE